MPVRECRLGEPVRKRAGLVWLWAVVEAISLAGVRADPPPLHLTIVSHNEDAQPFLQNQTYYLRNRDLVRQLALAVEARGAVWNFQSDWNFLRAIAQWDTPDVTATTNGKNLLRWLVEDMGFEADPHAHENQYNYADVAYLHEQLGVAPSKNVGGFLFDPPDNPQGWEQHEQGIEGRVYPSYFWRADHLWGAATRLHQGNDDRSYGMWRPQDRFQFYPHDPARRLDYIGGGCSSNAGASEGCLAGVERILGAIANGSVPADGFYTANIMVPQGQLDDAMIARVTACLDAIAPYVASGRVIWSTLTATADRWRNDYGGRPFRVDCSALSELRLSKSGSPGAAVHLEWLYGAPPYTLWRAEDPLFTVNPVTLLDEQEATSFDDPVLNDVRAYFYRID